MGILDAPATADTLTGATTVGKAVVKATDAVAARTAISAVGRGDLVFHVRDYGAVWNGVADDTTAFRAAAAAANAAGGGTIQLPPGSGLVTASISISSAVSVRGTGKMASIILNQSPTGVFAFTGSVAYNQTFADFGVVSSGSGSHVWNIAGHVMAGGLIKDIYIDNSLTPTASVIFSDGILDTVIQGQWWTYKNRTVPMFDLQSTAGNASDNTFAEARLTDTGTPTIQAIRHTETTQWALGNKYRQINMEAPVCGGFLLSQHALLELDGIYFWDLGTPHPTSITPDGTNWTIVFASAHQMVVGSKFTLTVFTPSGYNGSLTVATVVNTTTVTVTNATNPGTITAFGLGARATTGHMINFDSTNLPNYAVRVKQVARMSGVLGSGMHDISVASGLNNFNMEVSQLFGSGASIFDCASNNSQGFTASGCYFTTIGQYTNSVAAGAAAGAGATAATNGGANRYDGVITVNTGTGTAAGVLATVTQPNAFGFANVPTVVISPMDATTATSGLYVSSVTGATFVVSCATALTASTAGFKFSYQIKKHVNG